MAGWREFVLFAPRTNFLSANKEGIVSLFGYLAIHLLGLSTGTMILPPSPSYFRRQQLERFNSRSRRDSNANQAMPSSGSSQREDDKTATELAAYAILWWTFLGLSSLFASVAGVSRRLVCFISCCYSSPHLLSIGQPAVYSVGGGIQHLLYPRLSSAGSFLLSVAAFQINLFPDIQAEGSEG